LVDPVDDHAPPPLPRPVLVHLEDHLRIRPHHPDLSALDRLDVDALPVPDVEHGDDVGLALGMAADPADDLLAQERVDLPVVELFDHLDSVRGETGSPARRRHYTIRTSGAAWSRPRRGNRPRAGEPLWKQTAGRGNAAAPDGPART